MGDKFKNKNELKQLIYIYYIILKKEKRHIRLLEEEAEYKEYIQKEIVGKYVLLTISFERKSIVFNGYNHKKLITEFDKTILLIHYYRLLPYYKKTI